VIFHSVTHIRIPHFVISNNYYTNKVINLQLQYLTMDSLLLINSEYKKKQNPVKQPKSYTKV